MSSLRYVMPYTASFFCKGRQIDYASLFKFNHLLANLANRFSIVVTKISYAYYFFFNIMLLKIKKILARSMH